MTDLRQAAQQALEALENIDKAMPFPVGKQAITALRKALEQPEQEPHSYCYVQRGSSVDVLTFDGQPPDAIVGTTYPLYAAPPAAQPKPVSMRMPKMGDKVICLEDESIGTVVSLTAGGSPDIAFDDGSRGTYLLREFAELFGYVTPPAAQPEPPSEWDLIKNILAEYGLDAIAFVSDWKAAQRPWQGLTEFQFAEIYNKWNDTNGSTPWGLNQALEAKLRKLNK